MPDWITNWITIRGSSDNIESFIKKCLINRQEHTYDFDFSSIIPCPEEIKGFYVDFKIKNIINKKGNTNEGDLRKHEKEMLEKSLIFLDKYEALDYQEWAYKNWDTRPDPEVFFTYSKNPSELLLQFETAWDAPRKVFDKMAQIFPNLHFGIASQHENGQWVYSCSSEPEN